MSRPVIGWEASDPVPDRYLFNSYLQTHKGNLYFEDLNLAGLLQGGEGYTSIAQPYPSPLEIIYLPKIRQNIRQLQTAFERAIQKTGYAGRFLYAYASKANAAEEVVRTVLDTGVHYEISSAIDVEIVKLMMARGHFKPDQIVICNGFKQPGTTYAQNILNLQKSHPNILPILEDPIELKTFLETDAPFDLGIRQRGLSSQFNGGSLSAEDSRFGMGIQELWQTAIEIQAAPHLQLKLYHAMVGSQITSETDFVSRLTPAIDQYAQMRQKIPSLQIFDYGGGVPAAMTLNLSFDYQDFAEKLLSSIHSICSQRGVPDPDVMGEMGRYTVAEHGAHLFKVLSVKESQEGPPWYIIDGSIMSSLPDTWALGEHFIVLPLNHLDQPFRQVRLGGITCDSDDIYPPHGSKAPLYLPADTADLYLGFFAIGAYQEMLGGVGGSKHCIIPEACELIVDRSSAGDYIFERLPGQTKEKVMTNLGYRLSTAGRPEDTPEKDRK